MAGFVGRLTYGDRVLEGVVPAEAKRDGRLLPLQLPEEMPPIDADRAFSAATEALIPLLRRHRDGLITIGVDDYTRPNVHTRLLLPRLLRFLRSQGVDRARARILVAGGTHRPPRPDEYPKIMGDAVWQEYGDLVEPHDCDGALADLGTLDDDTPVEFNATAARAAVHIALTDLEYHYFAGVAGGPKQLMPGLAGRAVITAEHLRMFGPLGFAPNADLGVVDENPVYDYKRKVLAVIRDRFEASGHDLFGVTCVVDPRGRIVHLAGGDVETTHREARPVLDAVYTATLPGAADVVVMGARQYSVNLYQTGKAFNAARRAAKLGGEILVTAPLPDGWGNGEFERLTKRAVPILEAAHRDGAGDDPRRGAEAVDAMLREVQAAAVADFRIGKQKPVDLLVTLRHVGWGRLYLVSEGIPPEDQRTLPIEFVGRNDEDAVARIRAWTTTRERARPTYALVDDPALRIRVSD